MKFKTTFVNRNNTNNFVFEEANKLKNPKNKENKNIKKFSEYVETKQEKLLLHVIREKDEEPTKQCTFDRYTVRPKRLSDKRVGRPKDNWTEKVYQRIAIKNSLANDKKDFRRRSDDIIKKIEQKAIDRENLL